MLVITDHKMFLKRRMLKNSYCNETLKNETASKDTKAKKNDPEEEDMELDHTAPNVAVAQEATAQMVNVAANEVKDQKSEYVIDYTIAKKIMTDMSDELKEVEKERAEMHQKLDEKRKAMLQIAESRMESSKMKKQKFNHKKESDEEEE